ncbi:MAG: hypothetical protein DRP76_02230, partial [Candidatus Omnitrophota bacterium]
MMVWNKELRERVFSKGGYYNMTKADLIRRIANTVIPFVTVLIFAFLFLQVLCNWGFLGVINTAFLPLAGLGYSLIVAAGIYTVFRIIQKIVVDRALGELIAFKGKFKGKKLSTEELEGLKRNAPGIWKKIEQRIMWLNTIKLFLYLATILIVPWIPSETVISLPGLSQTIIKILAFLFFVDTFRWTFYSINYWIMGIHTSAYYRKWNVYEVHNRYRYKEIAKRLVALFTDTRPGWFNKESTRGKERIALFRKMIEEFSKEEDYHFVIYGETLEGLESLLSSIEAGGIGKEEAIKKFTEFLKEISQDGEVEVDGMKVRYKREHAYLRIINWINSQYRMDLGTLPFSMDEVLPSTVIINAYAEDPWFNKELLFEKTRDFPLNIRSLTVRLGILAKYRTELFIAMLEWLKTKGLLKEEDEDYKELLKLIVKPDKDIKISDKKIVNHILKWANYQLPSTWANARSARRTLEKIYTYFAEQFGVEDIKKEVEKRIRVIYRHITSLELLDKALGGKLRAYLYNLPEDKREKERIKNEIYNKIDEALEREIIKKKKDADALKAIVELIIEEGVFFAWTKGRLGALEEEYHGAKWNQLTSALPFIISLTALLVDADHHFYFDGLFGIVQHNLEYYYNPGLGATIPIVDHNLSKGLPPLGNVFPVGENAFYHHTHTGKMLLGGLGAYGKFLVRTALLKWLEGVTDSYVAEDIETPFRFRSFGYTVGRAGGIKLGKFWSYLFAEMRNPIRKWAYDWLESAKGKVPLKMLISPYVDWPYRVNNFLLDGFGFYSKKLGVVRYAKWAIVFCLVFKWNIFLGVLLALWFFGAIQSQRISYGLWFYKVFDEARGWIRGTVSAIWDILTKMYWVYVHMLWVYEECAGILASLLLGKFVRTKEKGGNVVRDSDPRSIFVRSSYAIPKAAFWFAIVFFLSGFHPIKGIIFAFLIFMPVAGFSTPFIFNPAEGLKDKITNFWWAIWYGFFWGLVDTISLWEYKIERLLRIQDPSLDRLAKICIEPAKKLGNVPFVDDLEPFYIYPSWYRRIYGHPSVLLVTRVINGISRRIEEAKVEEFSPAMVKIDEKAVDYTYPASGDKYSYIKWLEERFWQEVLPYVKTLYEGVLKRFGLAGEDKLEGDFSAFSTENINELKEKIFALQKELKDSRKEAEKIARQHTKIKNVFEKMTNQFKKIEDLGKELKKLCEEKDKLLAEGKSPQSKEIKDLLDKIEELRGLLKGISFVKDKFGDTLLLQILNKKKTPELQEFENLREKAEEIAAFHKAIVVVFKKIAEQLQKIKEITRYIDFEEMEKQAQEVTAISKFSLLINTVIPFMLLNELAKLYTDKLKVRDKLLYKGELFAAKGIEKILFRVISEWFNKDISFIQKKFSNIFSQRFSLLEEELNKIQSDLKKGLTKLQEEKQRIKNQLSYQDKKERERTEREIERLKEEITDIEDLISAIDFIKETAELVQEITEKQKFSERKSDRLEWNLSQIEFLPHRIDRFKPYYREVISKVLTPIVARLREVCDYISEFYNKRIKPEKDNVVKKISAKVITPIAKRLREVCDYIPKFYNKKIKPKKDKALNFTAGILRKFISIFYNETTKSMVRILTNISLWPAKFLGKLIKFITKPIFEILIFVAEALGRATLS